MKKINKLFKFSSSIIMCALIFLSGLISVKAISAPDSMIVDNYEAGYANNPLNIDRSFQVKQASDGKYVYCMAYNLLVPENTKYVNKGVTNDAGVSYIIKKGANDKSLNEYFVTQVSLWIYLLDNNLMQDSSAGSIKAYRSTVYSSSYDNNTLAKEIRQTVADAKKATKDSGASLNISNTVAITKENNNYVTSVIYVNTSASDYQVKLENAPLNASYEKVNNGFIVKVPTSSVSRAADQVDAQPYTMDEYVIFVDEGQAKEVYDAIIEMDSHYDAYSVYLSYLEIDEIQKDAFQTQLLSFAGICGIALAAFIVVQYFMMKSRKEEMNLLRRNGINKQKIHQVILFENGVYFVVVSAVGLILVYFYQSYLDDFTNMFIFNIIVLVISLFLLLVNVIVSQLLLKDKKHFKNRKL